MPVKNILATACGGPSTLSFTRSLRDADPKKEKYNIIGTDCDEYNIHRAEVDKSYLCPKATDSQYIPFIKNLIKKESIDFIHSQPEIEAFTIGKHRSEIEALGCKIFMPKQETIELLRDKSESYRIWLNAGITVPENIDINNKDDLELAFSKFEEEIWVRETIGAAGQGSLSRPTFEEALSHIESRNGWGHTVAAQHLGDSQKTITWQSIWNNGRLVVAQGRRRLYWAFANRSQSGVTGLTGTGMTINDEELDKLAIKCIKAADTSPHGIFSVDFTYDNNDIPNPTEINIAKFFTTHHFITKAGCNMPQILLDLAFGEYTGHYDIFNPCKEEMYWIRGIDVIPILIHQREIEEKIEEYHALLNSLK